MDPPCEKKGAGISIVLYRPNITKLSKTLRHLRTAVSTGDKIMSLEETVLILVDNSVPSTDTTIIERLVREKYFGFEHPRHKVVLKSIGKNIGYGAAHNQAIWSHNYSYHLILNPDVYLYPDALATFLMYSETNRNVVMITPMVLSPDRSVQYLLRRDPTLTDVTLRFLGIFLRFLTKLRRYQQYECRDIDMNKIQTGYVMSGCCMWCRTEALRVLGGFDERFFLYWEDYDLSRRLRMIGQTVYLPHARVIHDWDREMAKSFRLMLINIRSAIMFFRKWGWKIL